MQLEFATPVKQCPFLACPCPHARPECSGFGEVWLSQALLLLAMVGVAVSLRSRGANLVPNVREKVQHAWAAWLIVPLLLALNESILFEAVLV